MYRAGDVRLETEGFAIGIFRAGTCSFQQRLTGVYWEILHLAPGCLQGFDDEPVFQTIARAETNHWNSRAKGLREFRGFQCQRFPGLPKTLVGNRRKLL